MVIVSFQMIINDSSKRDEIFALFAEINKVHQSGKDGCITHDAYANLWEPNRLRFYAEFESHESCLAHEDLPAHKKLVGKLRGYQESGALTIQFDTLRRYKLDNPLPEMAM